MSSYRIELTAVVMVTTLAVTFFTQLLPGVLANPIEIASIDPPLGTVGTIVRVIGEIDTSGGPYEIWWDYEILLKEGNCPSGSNEVDDTFTVPSSPEGVHDIVLVDVTSYTESIPAEFVLATSYTMSVEPARIQEGLNTTITVSLQGAAANESYTLTMTVTTPTTASYTSDLTVTIDNEGVGTASKIYWGDFPDANTHFVGTYSIAINESLATGNFTVGLTNKLVYGSTETVYIRGSGYYPNENVTANIKFDNASIAGYPKNVTADMEGVVTDSWNISIDAPTGIYIVTLESAATPGTIKEPADVQEFSLRLICQIQARNLPPIDEPVADVTVEVYNMTTGDFLISEKTNKTGWATFSLERGNYTFNAFWMNVHVGSLPNQTLIGSLELMLECQLARIGMTVKDETQVPLPFIDVSLTYNYTTRDEENLTKTHSLETDFTGTATAYNLLTNINYTIEARRYGYLFNTTHIENLTTSHWIYITCPTYALFIHVLDSKETPLQNVQVKVYEWISGLTGLVGEGNTDDHGSINFIFTFGKYRVRVYSYSSALGHTVLLNETAANLIEDRLSFVVHCKIFNVDLSVRIVDYFGQPIPNAAVEFEREGVKIWEDSKTGSRGLVLLQNVIGGDYRISVYVGGRLAEVQTFRIDESTEILFKIEGYVAIGGHLLETSQLITLISVSVLSASSVLILTYRRLLLFVRRIGETLSSKVRRQEIV